MGRSCFPSDAARHMRILALQSGILAVLQWTTLHATSIILPDPPSEPKPEEVLKANGLDGTDEAALLAYVETHTEHIAAWLPEIGETENRGVRQIYLEQEAVKAGQPPRSWKAICDDL